MNGELAQISAIVMSARKALHEGAKLDFVLDKYVLSIKFIFVQRGKIIKKSVECDSVYSWYNTCQKYNLEDIKLIVPSTVENRYLLGFSNYSNGSIVCFWRNGLVTYFSPTWEFDKNSKGWNIVYKEFIWEDAPEGKPSFTDHSEEFSQVLLSIEKLAIDIEFKNFADIFHRAYIAINDCSFIEESHIPTYIPDEFKGIYYAITTADVFGAMGSWNDSPPYYAHEKGLTKEYDALSSELLKQLRINLMYIVNECWT